MYNTYYLSPLGFEFLLSLTVSHDVLIPTKNALNDADKSDIYREIGNMSRDGLLRLDEDEQKIVVEPEVLHAFKKIAASKRIAVINSHLRPGGAMCIYHSDCYVTVEMTVTRPDKVKLSLLEDDLINEYFDDVTWLNNGNEDLLEDFSKEDEAFFGEGVLLSAEFYISPQQKAKEKIIVVNDDGQKKLLQRCGENVCSSQDYDIEKLIEKLVTFFEEGAKEEDEHDKC